MTDLSEPADRETMAAELQRTNPAELLYAEDFAESSLIEGREEAVLAFVILQPGESCSEGEIIDWCADKLADFKVPGFVRFVSDFPRTSLGKVQKNILKRQALREPPATSYP